MKKWQEWKFLVTFLYLHIISEFFDFPKKWRFFFLTDQNASFMKKIFTMRWCSVVLTLDLRVCGSTFIFILELKSVFFKKKTVSYLIEQESFYPLLQKGQKDQRENREAEYRGE
jgi:hypothetical protein